MNHEYMFSLVTVCYNSEKTIKRTINSIINQTCQDYEYIIVDGKSNDSTLQIINSFKPILQNRLKVISEKDNGIYNAMNKGIRYSSGIIIGIVNSDDYLEKDALEKVKELYNPEIKYQVIYGAVRYIDMNSKELYVLFSNINNIKNNMIPHPGVFVTRNVYSDICMFDESYVSAADYNFILDIYEDGRVAFSPLYYILSNFTIGGISSNRALGLETIKVKYLHGLISRKDYIKRKIALLIKMISNY